VVVAGGQELGHLLEAGSQGSPGAGGQLQDQVGAGPGRRGPGLVEGAGQGQEGLPGAGQAGGAAAGQGGAGMDDDPGGAEAARLGQGGRDHLAGPFPGDRAGAGEVDQVGRVDEQGAEPGLLQAGPEAFVGGRVERGRGPAAGVGGEHLERLAAGGEGVADGPVQAAGDRDVGADAHVRAGWG
jgi:hypothetical protein